MYVYLLRAFKWYKIGRTRKLTSRVKALRTEPPFEIELIHLIECDNSWRAEKILHGIFSEKRVKGEWFALDAEDVELICGVDAFSKGEFYRSSETGVFPAYGLGCDAGRKLTAGPTGKNPFAPGTVSAKSWDDGYHDCYLYPF